ncbi:MAG TPA: hypothetical protein VMD30_03235 [Tepidisphaeraceae bacterium]|nr:hypothetical protein [Tepidisphaeraceae bacterium]
MNAIARRRQMSGEHLAGAHEVRDFRNDITHEGVREVVITFGDCKARLARFLSWLPLDW